MALMWLCPAGAIPKGLCHSAQRWTAREKGAEVPRWGKHRGIPSTLKAVGSSPAPQPSTLRSAATEEWATSNYFNDCLPHPRSLHKRPIKSGCFTVPGRVKEQIRVGRQIGQGKQIHPVGVTVHSLGAQRSEELIEVN